MSLLQHHGTTVKSDKLFTSEDVEMQQPPKQRRSAVVDNPRVTALECLFGLPREHVAMWPGAMAYCQYLEKCFAPLLTEDYATVWSVIRTRKPKVQAECWQWFMAVTSAIQSLKSEDSSVEDIWDKMRPSTSEDNSTHPTAFEKITCLIAIFAVLCWGTMALQPRLNWDGFKDSPCLMVEQQRPNQPGLKIELVRRPLPALFRLFRRTMLTSRWRTPIGSTGTDSSTALYVSSLNYASLNMIGKINVVWVDSISSHLDFNSANRQLSIFKFPSFCALSTSDDCRAAPVFVGLLRALYSANNNADASDAVKDCDGFVQAHQEILMSYRLVFGQSRGARRLARAVLRMLREEETAKGEYDQLLDVVCTRPCDGVVRALPPSFWPVSCRSFEGSLQEESAYSSQDDFPMFGARLAKLQEFNLRQQPSKLRDLWRDRRNPLQWYTFWAVLVVGGVSILLSFLQLVVSVAQLVVAIKTAPPS